MGDMLIHPPMGTNYMGSVVGMLIKLAIWYLRLRKVSVLINYKVGNGYIKQLSDFGRTFDNEFDDVDYLLSNGAKFDVPKGKFSLKMKRG